MTENNSATGAHTDTSYMIFPETDSGNAHINEARTNVTGETNPLAGTNAYPDNGSILVDLDGDGDLDLVVWSWYDNFVCFENTGTTDNTAGNRLEGSAGDDMLHGGPGNDTLIGGEGDDLLQGGPGADNLNGGPGQDTATYVDSPAGVTVRLDDLHASRGDAEGDTFEGLVSVNFTNNAGITYTVSLPDIENLTGSAFDDILAGDLRVNVLAGGDGNDFLDGGSGIDTLHGGEGDDFLWGGPGADSLYGGGGQDTAAYWTSLEGVIVRLHSLHASGGDADGDIFAGLVSVSYTDADGITHTESLPDIENLEGSGYDDILAGDRRDNVLDGGPGDDIVYGGPGGGDDLIYGGPGDDTMYGGLGDDQLFGGLGNDSLYGGAGEDRLAGGVGNDLLIGGPGADVYVFEPRDDDIFTIHTPREDKQETGRVSRTFNESGDDIVTGFTHGEDKIDLSAFELKSLDDLTITVSDAGVTIDLTEFDGGTILLADVQIVPDTGDFLV